MNRVLLSVIAVVVLVVASAATARASFITVGDANNVAPLATVTASSAGVGDLAPVGHAIDTNVSDGVPGSPSFDDSVHFGFLNDTAPYTLDLAWATPQHLTSLQAYVGQGGAAFPDADRTVSAIEFSVDQGAGWVSLGSVSTVNTDDAGSFDLTKIDGDWAGVEKARYAFTGSSGAQGPRVAEVLAQSVPEPSTVVLLTSALLGLLAYAWRKRR
jgi:hypothetical protein